MACRIKSDAIIGGQHAIPTAAHQGWAADSSTPVSGKRLLGEWFVSSEESSDGFRSPGFMAPVFLNCVAEPQCDAPGYCYIKAPFTNSPRMSAGAIVVLPPPPPPPPEDVCDLFDCPFDYPDRVLLDFSGIVACPESNAPNQCFIDHLNSTSFGISVNVPGPDTLDCTYTHVELLPFCGFGASLRIDVVLARLPNPPNNFRFLIDADLRISGDIFDHSGFTHQIIYETSDCPVPSSIPGVYLNQLPQCTTVTAGIGGTCSLNWS